MSQAGLLIIFSALATFGQTPSPDNAPSPPDPARLEAAFRLVEEAVARNEIPGASVLVAQHGRPLRAAAYGLSDPERNVAFQTNTICWIASMTKAVTVAAVMKLVEERKVGLDDPVEKYLPEFAGRINFNGKHYPFTLRQLMVHTAGLPLNMPGQKVVDLIGGVLTEECMSQRLPDIVHALAKTPLLFEPGTRQEYSSPGYFVLGRIIEVVSGQPYASFMQERLFEPLGMRDTSYAPPPSQAGRMAALYQERRGKRTLLFRFNPELKIQNTRPDGGIFSTTQDMAKFLQLFLDNNGTILSRQSVAEMLKPHLPGFVFRSKTNAEVSTALGFTVKDDVFIHGGSSGVMGWADRKSGAVGLLFIQFADDQRRGERLRIAFREAVQNALGGSPSNEGAAGRNISVTTPSTNNIPRYEVFGLQLTSSETYGNPFADVTVTAAFTAPSGRTLTAYAFHDGGDIWRVRFAPDETGTWSYTTTASDKSNTGLHNRTGSFTCVSSTNKGFIRPDPVHEYWFAYDDGTPFWGNGDTCYYIVNGISLADRTNYLATRSAQGFNFVRFHPCGSPDTSPFVNGNDLDRFNLTHFQALDGLLADFKAHNMRAEVIVLNRYHLPFKDTNIWTPAREDRYVRYIVSRLAPFTQVFLWTVCNEYEVYPKGKYADPAPEDNAWAEQIGGLLHSTDPHRHPTTVHPWEQPMMDRAKLMADRFGTSTNLDVLTHQYYGDARLTDRKQNIWHGPGLQRGPAPDPARPFYIGSGEGVDRVVRLDRTCHKPVINTESSYEHYDGSNYGGWASTDLARRQAWRVFMGGGAAHAAGFEGTFWALKLAGTPGRSAFFLEDKGLAAQLKYRYDFITTRTRFQDMSPAQTLVNSPNVCLANPGREYVVYAPSGGTITLDLSKVSEAFSVEWLNPRAGTYRPDSAVSGGRSRSFNAEDANDWVLHLTAALR